MSAPSAAQDRLWAALGKELKLEPPSAPDRFLGCYQRSFTAKAGDLASVLGLKPELYPRTGKKDEVVKPQPLTTIKGYDPKMQCRGYIYGLSEYVQKNVERYTRDTNTANMNKAETPFLDDSREPMGMYLAFQCR